jgi:hypothetical protein
MTVKMQSPPEPRPPVKVVCPNCGASHLLFDGPREFICHCGQRIERPPPQTGTKEEDRNG